MRDGTGTSLLCDYFAAENFMYRSAWTSAAGSARSRLDALSGIHTRIDTYSILTYSVSFDC